MCVLKPEATRYKEIQPKKLSAENQRESGGELQRSWFHCGGEAASDLTELKMRFEGICIHKRGRYTGKAADGKLTRWQLCRPTLVI